MIAITGTGVVSPLGIGNAEFIHAIKAGRSAIHALGDDAGISVGARFDTPYRPESSKQFAWFMDSVTRYAVAAAHEAVEMADLSHLAPSAIGTIMGIGICGVETMDDAYRKFYAEGQPAHPFMIPRGMPSGPASGVTIALGTKGPSFCTTSACASSAHAIITGATWLQAGLADAMVVGGAEAPFGFGMLHAWRAMRIMADDTCRPFSVRRRGMVLGDGAAALVMERLDDARKRGANILAVLKGFAANADAGHIVRPDEDSIVRAMTLALNSAGLSAGDIGHVNGHATGTQLNDLVESAAIARVFGAHRPYVSGTKGATGHTLGAASAIEAVITVHALADQWIPPTINSLGVDPNCTAINVSPSTAVHAAYGAAMSNSFAFGGLNGVLVFAR